MTSPFFAGIMPLDKRHLPGEIVAGLALAALAVPSALGYAAIAGMPLATGLYTVILPLAAFALLGSSRHLIVGADSATAAVMAATLAGMAPTGSPEYVRLAGLCAVLTGGVLLLARGLRLGFVADFLSRSVLIGFLTGVGLQVATSQLPVMLGLPANGHSTVEALAAVVLQLDQASGPTVGLSIGLILVMLGIKRLARHFPGPLVAMLAAIALSWAFDLPRRGVAVLGAVPAGLPALSVPWNDWIDVPQIVGMCLAMALVIVAQSAATARAYAGRYSEALDENADLVGLGVANVLAGLSGAFVVNGSPTKTQAADDAGGRSQLVALVCAAAILLVVAFATGPLALVPKTALGAVVFLIGVELIDVDGLKRILAARPDEFVVALVTAGTVVLAGVQQAIGLAVILSLLDHVRLGYRPRNRLLVPDGNHWRTAPISTRQQALPGLVIYRFNHSLYYANAQRMLDEALDVVSSADEPARWFCLDADAVDDVDFSAEEVLRQLHKELAARNVRLVLSGVDDDVRFEMDRSGLTGVLGANAFYNTLAEVVEHYLATFAPAKAETLAGASA